MSDHAFLAVDLTADERHALAGALSEASPGRPIPGRRPPPENWHVTLRFLGECSEAQAQQIMYRLSESVDASPERVWCVGLGAFPKVSSAGVVYGVLEDPSGLLPYLSAVCDEAAVDAGLAPEERPFIPHITLSRLRPPVDVRSFFAVYGDFRIPIDVTAITLMRTHRTRDGIRYTSVDRLTLT